jgi:5'-3' exonuclease
MGVLRLFRLIVKKYPDCLIHLHGKYEQCVSDELKDINIDWIEYDLNSIFHPVIQELHQNKSKPSKAVSLLRPQKPSPPVPEQPEHIIFQKICERLENIRKILPPKKGLYFAIDGTAGMSKCCQQRKRRFKTVMDKKTMAPTTDWDSTKLSCGTVFMDKLGKYINDFAQRQISDNSEWKNFEVIVSDARVPSEGEHKLLNHMRANPNNSYGIISPDADFIFLACGLHKTSSYIFRENIFDDVDADFFLVIVQKFRQCIIQEIGLQNETDETVINRTIEDFIVYCFSIGNDFLPSIPSINLTNDGIDELFGAYRRGHFVPPKGTARLLNPADSNEMSEGLKGQALPLRFISEKLPSGEFRLCKNGMKKFMSELADREEKMLIYNYEHNQAKKADSLMKKHLIISENEKTFDFESYRTDYYKEKFNGVDRKIVVHEYLRGMTFVLRYYLESIPSWHYSYPFSYAPLFKDISDYLDDFDFTFSFELSSPFSAFEQLLAILPPASAYLLPKPLQFLLTSPESPICDFYPEHFEVDSENKKNDYESIILLPHVEPERIRNAFRSVESLLSSEDRERNCIGEISRYKSIQERIEYRPNGKLWTRSFYRNEKLEGEYKEWLENGQLVRHYFYRDGVPEGKQKSFHENGLLARHEYYKNGRLEGECKFYSTNGKIFRHLYYAGDAGTCRWKRFSFGKKYAFLKLKSAVRQEFYPEIDDYIIPDLLKSII